MSYTAALDKGADLNMMIDMPIRERIGRFKYVKEDEIDKMFDDILYNLDVDIESIIKKGDE